MKKKLFRYGYLIRIAFDHGRLFPILTKQRIVSNFIAGASAQIIEIPNTFSLWISEMLYKTNSVLIDFVSSNAYQIFMKLFSSMYESQVRLSVF